MSIGGDDSISTHMKKEKQIASNKLVEKKNYLCFLGFDFLVRSLFFIALVSFINIVLFLFWI